MCVFGLRKRYDIRYTINDNDSDSYSKELNLKKKLYKLLQLQEYVKSSSK